MEVNGPDGTVDWRCRSIDDSTGALSCDSVTWPLPLGGLEPVRFNGTYDLAVTLRVYNHAGNQRTTTPYRARINAAAQDWVVEHDTDYLPAVGNENERTDWHTHVWYANPLAPGDSLTIALLGIGREGSSFWPDYSLQFQRIRLTLNQTFEDDPSGSAQGHSTWLYGAWSDPTPPPPPPGGSDDNAGGGHGWPYTGR